MFWFGKLFELEVIEFVMDNKKGSERDYGINIGVNDASMYVFHRCVNLRPIAEREPIGHPVKERVCLDWALDEVMLSRLILLLIHQD